MKKILAFILVVLWSLLIFGFSSDNGEESTSLTTKFISNVVSFVTPIKKDSKEMNDLIKKISYPVRKCAHFFVYFVLGFLSMNFLYILGVKRYTLIIASLYCVIFSISDELHQTFVSGRSGNINDILLDSSASLLANYFYHRFIIMRYYYAKVK